jgi:pyroglutamyl-peptidase
MARPRVLLTGFGPFPGVAENPSGWLAETLAAQTATAGYELHGHVLPTEWEAVTSLTPRLYTHLQPKVMIHFGVGPRAKTLRIEHSAQNRAARRGDAQGLHPSMSAISPDGQHRLDTRLPVNALAAYLRTRGYAASASRSCGSYLCNFLYYRSLEWTRQHGGDALFVHVPLAQGAALDDDALLTSGQETLNFVIEAMEAWT